MGPVARFRSALRRIGGRIDRQDEREFLPAALEVLETPPSPAGRLLGLTIVAFFVAALAWSFLGKVDILATAPGQVLPAGEVKIIQPLDAGLVRSIHIQDGDHVSAGQLLIELDPTQAAADTQRLASDLIQARLDVARLTALKNNAETGAPLALAAPQGAPPDLVDEARDAMIAQAAEQSAKVADLTRQIGEKAAETAEANAELDKINAEAPVLAEKERIHHDLTVQGYGTSLAYLDAQQQLIEARHERTAQVARAAQTRETTGALEVQRTGARAEYEADILSDLRKAEAQQSELSQELIQAQQKAGQSELRSPIDGVVDQLAVHTLGGVVTPAEHLLIVVPDNHQLTIEAELANRDVGFVHVGQPVKIKVETFNFTRYGLLDGRVVGVSRDVILPDAQQAANDQAQAGSQSSRGPSPTYVARIVPAKTSMIIDGRAEQLQPGMSVTSEIKTGERTIIDYLLSPLSRRAQESFHER